MSCFINESMHGNLSVGRHVTVIAHPYDAIEIENIVVDSKGCVWLHLVNGFQFTVKYYKSTGWSLVGINDEGKVYKLPRSNWQQDRYRLVKRKERPQ